MKTFLAGGPHGADLAQARGRQRTRSCGHFVVQAMSGLARATRAGALLDEAIRLFDSHESYNCEPFYGALNDETLFELALAAQALGRSGDAERLLICARQAGSVRSLASTSG